MSVSAWRVFFFVAATFNFAVGVPLVMVPGAMLVALGVPVPGDLLFHRLCGLFVVCFGIAYAFVRREPDRNRAIVWVGAIGKTGVVILIGQAWAQGMVPFQAFALTMGDLAFVAGFVFFLLSRKRFA
ncbi:MAG: hypothetical protein K8S25_15190 [Alphaproteobacteria bacterium]|nr:hypothetical protein [Alphaproteobacteria bacterium]